MKMKLSYFSANLSSEASLLLRQIGQLFSVTLVSQVIGLVRGMILPVLFLPAQLGVWNFLNVLFGYGSCAHLGLLSGMVKLVPSHLATAEEAQAHLLEVSIFWCNITLGVILSVGAYVASHVVPAEFRSGLRILAIAFAFQQVFIFFHAYLRGRSRFGTLSKGLILQTVLGSSLIVISALICQDRLLGALGGFVCSYLIAALFWLKTARIELNFTIDFQIVWRAFVVGLPLILASLLDVVFISIDRWAIAASCDADTLGYYALGVMAATMLGGVTTAASNVLTPKMIHTYAARKDYTELGPLYSKSLRIFAMLMALMVSLSVPCLVFVIQRWLPKYLPSLPLMYILQPTAFFMGISYIAGPFLVAIDRSWLAALTLTGALVFSAGLQFGAVYAGLGGQGIAAATLVASAALCFAYLVPSMRLINGSWRLSVLFIVRLLLPLAAGYGAMILSVTVWQQHCSISVGMGYLFVSVLAITVAAGGAFLVLNPGNFASRQLLKIFRENVYER